MSFQVGKASVVSNSKIDVETASSRKGSNLNVLTFLNSFLAAVTLILTAVVLAFSVHDYMSPRQPTMLREPPKTNMPPPPAPPSPQTKTDMLQAPMLPGVLPGKNKPKVILAQDVDWPPYAYVSTPPEGDFEVAGFGHDVAKGLQEVCDIEIVTRQTRWGECWGNNEIGAGLDNGVFHGCMTYTHTAGTRNRYVDFTHGILSANKPAGILTRLGSDGKPVLDPKSDLSGKKIVDVAGWAPTADGLSLVTNWCTGSRYTGYTVLTPSEGGNDAAMKMLRDGTADGMFVYADQAYNYRPDQPDVTVTWNTTLWTGLGTEFAYVGTGMLGHAYNGTTLAISKKGSGLSELLNPCIDKFLRTKAYLNVCEKHGFTSSCYPNDHFNGTTAAVKPWLKKTNEQPQGQACASGYCSCDAGVTTDPTA